MSNFTNDGTGADHRFSLIRLQWKSRLSPATGRSVVPSKADLGALKDIGVTCPASKELQWPNDPQVIKEWVIEIYSQTSKMMTVWKFELTNYRFSPKLLTFEIQL
jgi:hypothetical protein